MNGGDCYGETYCEEFTKCKNNKLHQNWQCINCNIDICGHCSFYQFKNECPLCQETYSTMKYWLKIHWTY